LEYLSGYYSAEVDKNKCLLYGYTKYPIFPRKNFQDYTVKDNEQSDYQLLVISLNESGQLPA